MERVLVAYGSRIGDTRRVAQDIAGLTAADLVSFDGAPRDLSEYRVVVIGACGDSREGVESARRFIEEHRASLANIALFATCSPNEPSVAMQEWTAACGTRPIACLVLDSRKIESGWVDASLYAFANHISRALGRPSQGRATVLGSGSSSR